MVVDISQVHIKLCAVGRSIGEGRGYDVARESLEIAVAICVFISEVKAIEQSLFIVERTCDCLLYTSDAADDLLTV